MDLFILAAPMFVGAIYSLSSASRIAAAQGSENSRAVELRMAVGLVLLIGASWALIVGGFATATGESFDIGLP